MDHAQGVGERGGAVGQRGGAVGQRRALLGRGPISWAGGRLTAREKQGQGRLFLSNDTPWLAGERRPHKGPWPAGPARDRPGRADAAPFSQRGLTGPFCHRTRARPGDSFPHQPAQTFMFSELEGRRWKLGAPCPLRGATRTPRRVQCPGAQPALRPPAQSTVTWPWPPSGSGPAVPVPHSIERGHRAGRARPGCLGEGMGGGQGQGCRRPWQGGTPTPGGCRHYETVGESGGRHSPRGIGRGGRRPLPGTKAGARGARGRRVGVWTAASPHLPSRCPAAE